MLRAAYDREKRKWEHTTFIGTAILNYGGMRGKDFRPKKMDYFYREMFLGGAEDNMTWDKFEEQKKILLANQKSLRERQKKLPKSN